MPSIRRSRLFRLAPLVFALALLASACDSTTAEQLRDTPWVNIPIGRINGSSTGAIGIDGQMGGYHPCNDNRAENAAGYTQDTYYGACVMPSQSGRPLYSSYAYFQRWSGSQANWPSGMFFGNTGTCNDSTRTFCSPQGSKITHDWAKKWSEFSLEIYPDDPQSTGVRLSVPCCANLANGGAYTPVVGDIDLPRAGNPGTSPMQATITGATGTGQVAFDAFQVDESGPAHSSGGVPLFSFASGTNGSPGTATTWRVPAMYNGAYAVYISDRQYPNRKIVARLNLPAAANFNVNRNAPCFGITEPYSPSQWYLNVRLSSADCAAMWR